MHKLGFMHLLTPVFPFRLGKTLCQESAVRLHSGEHHSDLYAALQAGFMPDHERRHIFDGKSSLNLDGILLFRNVPENNVTPDYLPYISCAADPIIGCDCVLPSKRTLVSALASGQLPREQAPRL